MKTKVIQVLQISMSVYPYVTFSLVVVDNFHRQIPESQVV